MLKIDDIHDIEELYREIQYVEKALPKQHNVGKARDKQYLIGLHNSLILKSQELIQKCKENLSQLQAGERDNGQ